MLRVTGFFLQTLCLQSLQSA